MIFTLFHILQSYPAGRIGAITSLILAIAFFAYYLVFIHLSKYWLTTFQTRKTILFLLIPQRWSEYDCIDNSCSFVFKHTTKCIWYVFWAYLVGFIGHEYHSQTVAIAAL